MRGQKVPVLLALCKAVLPLVLLWLRAQWSNANTCETVTHIVIIVVIFISDGR